MGEVEREFMAALGKLCAKSGLRIPSMAPDDIIIEQVSSEPIWRDMYASEIMRELMGGMTEPRDRRVELRLIFRDEFVHAGSGPRPRHYDYDSTAEEIIEIEGPRKELPSGNG